MHPSKLPLTILALLLPILLAACRLDPPRPGDDTRPVAVPSRDQSERQTSPAAPRDAEPGYPEPAGQTPKAAYPMPGYPAPAAATPSDPAASSTRPVLAFPRLEQRLPPAGAAAPGSAPRPEARPDLARPDCPGIAVRQGEALAIDGQPFVFFGINAPFLMDRDFPEDKVEPILAELSSRGVNTLRVWFFHDEDPERFERLLDAGARQGIRFVVTMADDVHKGVDWFSGTPDEEASRPHIERTVARFASRPEILLWEPVNEPNCGDGRFDDACLETIRGWLGAMAERIKAIDGCRVVSTSSIGAGNFENEHAHYRKLHGKDAIEVLSVHKRSTDEAEEELETARDRERPIVYGEIYDEAYDAGCSPLGGDASTERRAERIKADLRQAIADGVDGYLLWELAIGRVENSRGDGAKDYCSSFGFEPEDPLWSKLQGSAEGLPPPVPWR